MQELPCCPVCQSENSYPDEGVIICADCGYEWDPAHSEVAEQDERIVKDCNGNQLVSGDTVILIKDLKLKGSSQVLKKGSKAKNIRLVDGDHEIDCKIDGSAIMLKACFVKKG
ncbi:zinc ribbon domain-containing protein YjdM [Orbaceae bacterium ESL0721]|nr:zinc ribbon domain-containing protein YjdM [Orbaceae bacterium ESL0721]